jgi:UrcA family protein
MTSILKIAATAFLITSGVAGGAPALAQDVTQPNVSIVQTSDLNLSTNAGRAALDHRLLVAATDVCGIASDADLVGKSKVRACLSEVLTKAHAQSVQLASRGNSILIAAAR